MPKGITTPSIVCITFRTSPFADYPQQLIWVETNVPIGVAIATC